jgi:hypothetical protein
MLEWGTVFTGDLCCRRHGLFPIHMQTKVAFPAEPSSKQSLRPFCSLSYPMLTAQ